MTMTEAEWIAAIERGDKYPLDVPEDLQKAVWTALIQREAERKAIEKKDGR